MELSVKERVVIAALYPAQSNLIEQTLIGDIIEKIKITQSEMEKVNFQIVEGQGVKWDEGKLPDKDVMFTDMELQLLKDQVEKLDKERKITQDILPLCLKIKRAG